MSKIPVRATADPRQNVPTWAMGLLGVLAAVKAMTAGWPVWAVVVSFVALVAFGVAQQYFTRPS